MKDKKGQVLVEFALVLPILLLFLFGVIDFSRYLYTKNTMNNAARAGARAASVITPPPTAVSLRQVSSPANNIERAINSNVSFNFIDVPSVTYALQITNLAGANVASGPAQSGDQVQVTVNWAGFQLLTPVIGRFFSPNVSGGASMRYE